MDKTTIFCEFDLTIAEIEIVAICITVIRHTDAEIEMNFDSHMASYALWLPLHRRILPSTLQKWLQLQHMSIC